MIGVSRQIDDPPIATPSSDCTCTTSQHRVIRRWRSQVHRGRIDILRMTASTRICVRQRTPLRTLVFIGCSLFASVAAQADSQLQTNAVAEARVTLRIVVPQTLTLRVVDPPSDTPTLGIGPSVRDADQPPPVPKAGEPFVRCWQEPDGQHWCSVTAP